MVTAAKRSLLKSRFVNGFLDTEIKTFSRLFPKQQFLFRDSTLSKSVIDRDLKKSRNKCFFHYSNLGTKTKINFTLSPFTTLFPGLENCWANFKSFFKKWRLCPSVHFIPFWRNITYRWISLELISWNSTQKENFVVAYLFPPEHMKLGIFMAQSCSDLSKQCTYQNLLLFWHSQCRGRIRCLSSFLSQGISQACIPGRFVLQRWSI